jgi:oligoribonuclease
MSKQDFHPTRLLWLDLEMTGLNIETDVLLEVAAKVTDFDFKSLGYYESIIRQDVELAKELMSKNAWWNEFDDNRQLFLEALPSGKPLAQVESELTEFVKKEIPSEPIVLAGSSIHVDRMFIRKWMPDFDRELHYRMLDVTSWKVVMRGKYNVFFNKSEAHRAEDDVDESIEEMKFYLKWFHDNYDNNGAEN